jgi:hypothetical protein
MLDKVRSCVDRRTVALASVPVVGAVLSAFWFAGVAGALTTTTTTTTTAAPNPTIVSAATGTTTAARTGLSHGIVVGVLVFGIVFAVMLIWKFARRGSKE